MRYLIGVLALALLCFATPPTRDWKKNPAIVVVDQQPEHLYALGDIHGDAERMMALLLRAGLVSPQSTKPQDIRWTGGSAVLVQTGDLIDKGPNPVAVIRLLSALRESARQAGGKVIVTMGNHEAEFLAGTSGKKSKDFTDDLKANRISEADVIACRGDIGEFLCALPFAAKVGDWFFSHGGNTAGMTVDRLGASLRDGVDRDGFGAEELADPDSLLEARLGEGKVWFHTSNAEREVLTGYAAALGVGHMVQGHQPGEVTFADGVVRHRGEMFQRWGLLFLTDTGMSRGVDDSKGAILVVVKGRDAGAVCPGGATTVLWDRASAQETGRAVPCTR